MRNLALVGAIALCVNLAAYPQPQPATASVSQDALANQFARLTPVVVSSVPSPTIPFPLPPREVPAAPIPVSYGGCANGSCSFRPRQQQQPYYNAPPRRTFAYRQGPIRRLLGRR